MFQLISVLISGPPATPRLVEAALSLVHGHQVNIDIAYEFSMTTYSSLNIQTVTPILPPILKTAYKNAALCHNFLSLLFGSIKSKANPSSQPCFQQIVSFKCLSILNIVQVRCADTSSGRINQRIVIYLCISGMIVKYGS